MNESSYTRTAIVLHWGMALMLACLFAVGLYMADLPLSPWKLQIFSWHKWAGVTAFLLVSVRLAWRFTHKPPVLPSSVTPLLQWVAHVGHFAIYLLMFAIPLSGWLMSSAKGFQTVYFGVLPIPDLIGKNKALGAQLAEVHETLNYVLLALVTGHAAAALKHHFWDRDVVLARMAPWVGRGGSRKSS